MRSVELDESVNGTAAADGTCTVAIGPVKRQIWTVENESLSCVSPVVPPTLPAAPTARLYGRLVAAGSQLANTYDGVNDSASVRYTLRPGGQLLVVWEGCDPGSVCTLSVYGTMLVPG